MKGLTTTEKLLVGFAILLFVFGSIFINAVEPYTRYKLPNGDIVECKNMTETTAGNYMLSSCKGGSEYYIQGTLEVVK